MPDLAQMSPEELAHFVKDNSELLLKRRAIKTDFHEWCRHVLSPMNTVPARHHRVLIDLLSKICSGEIKKLLVMMPPGSAKSSYVSQMFPPWWYVHHPHTNIIAGSNTQRLAEKFSRSVRLLVEQNASYLGYGLNEAQTGLLNWAVTNGSEYISVGSEGAVLGHRADLVIIDDPYKSRADAQSEVVREAVWTWYTSDIMSRLKPDGRICIVMTRFHTDDLCGRLLELEPDEWTVVRFSAICDEPDDPLGREIGELLWPEYQTQAFYDSKRSVGGEYDWASSYQQRPVPIHGTIFDARMLEKNIEPTIPTDIVATCRAWDLAAGIEGDYTVGLKLGRRADGRYIILDVVRFRAEPSKVEATLQMVADMDGKGTKIALSQDPGQAGKFQVQHLTRMLAGFSITSERETGEKIVRAQPIASQVNIGNVAMLQGGWNRALLSELATYPSSRNDDQVDSLSRAFGVLSAVRQPGYSSRVDFMAR